ncbi:MAG TPA: hypothetical protein VMV81_13015 [Phycisphaerae bacterium]|nr:hypothetical protein [Phycisphaerae bacterium]
MTDECTEHERQIEQVKASRGPEWAKIFETLREYRMSNMVCAEDGETGYPLVDLMSDPTPGATIASGEDEMVALADEIADALGIIDPAAALAALVAADEAARAKRS